MKFFQSFLHVALFAPQVLREVHMGLILRVHVHRWVGAMRPSRSRVLDHAVSFAGGVTGRTGVGVVGFITQPLPRLLHGVSPIWREVKVAKGRNSRRKRE